MGTCSRGHGSGCRVGGTLEVIAPADIRKSVAVPVDGETEKEMKRREEVFQAVLDATKY